MKNSFFLLFLLLFACAKKTETQQNSETETVNVSEQQAQVSQKNTIRMYFDQYIAKETTNDDTIVVMKETDEFIKFMYSPKEGEIIGTIYISLKLLSTEGEPDKILYFLHSCVEGECNLAAENLKLYDSEWKELTATSIPIKELDLEVKSQIKNLQKDKKNKNFDSFFAKFDPDTHKIYVGIIKSQECCNITEGKDDIEFYSVLELYWNGTTKNFTKDDPNAG